MDDELDGIIWGDEEVTEEGGSNEPDVVAAVEPARLDQPVLNAPYSILKTNSRSTIQAGSRSGECGHFGGSLRGRCETR
jgi:hypothetical protein